MRRLQLGLAMVALPAFALTLFVAGCGKDEKKSESGGGGEVEQSKAKGELKVLEPKGGVLKGKITLKGKPDTDADTKKVTEGIEKLENKSQRDYCLTGSETEKTGQTYRIGDNGNLGNVFVWVKPDEGTFFKITKDQVEEAKKNPPKFRQPHCAFIPHCAVLFPQYRSDPKNPSKKEKTGQILEIVNDAEVGHNTNWKGGAKNSGGNETLEPGKKRDVDNLQADTTPVMLKCNIHGWMDAWLWVLDTPYYDISRSDTLDGKNKVAKDAKEFGTYEIKNLPAGKVRVFVWHEAGKWLNKNAGRGEVVEIKEGAPTEKDFEMEVK